MRQFFLAALPLIVSGCTATQISPENATQAAADLANADDKAAHLKQTGERVLRNAANASIQDQLDRFETRMMEGDVTHLEAALGIHDSDATAEATMVYRLKETGNHFTFNQTSAGYFDERTTLNTGIGHRYINADESLIIGGNVIYDYEVDSGHQRVSLGGEILSASHFQLRANYYRALTDEISHDGIFETALHGHDIKLTYPVPLFFGTDLFLKTGQWYRDGYRISSDEIGLDVALSPQLTLGLSHQKDEGESATQSVTLTYAFGGKSHSDQRRYAKNNLRSELYKPIQRENRIRKKFVRVGVTMSGFSS